MSNFEHFIINNNRLVVKGDKEKYNDIMKKLGGRWIGNRLKTGPGWTFDLKFRPKVVRFINTVKKAEKEEREKEEEEESEKEGRGRK